MNTAVSVQLSHGLDLMELKFLIVTTVTFSSKRAVTVNPFAFPFIFVWQKGNYAPQGVKVCTLIQKNVYWQYTELKLLRKCALEHMQPSMDLLCKKNKQTKKHSFTHTNVRICTCIPLPSQLPLGSAFIRRAV